jgi:hypothetical protein
MKEAYRLQKNELKNELEMHKIYLAIFIIYTEKSLPEFEMVFEKMTTILQRLKKIILQSDSKK